MKIINLTPHQFMNLETFPISPEISNKEGMFYYLRNLDWKHNEEHLLFKKMHVINKQTMNNKFSTINMLNDYQQEIAIKEFVIPKYFVALDDEIVGIAIDEVLHSCNLGLLLHDIKFPMEKKIDYLKRIGLLLKKTEKLSQYGIKFYFCDLHEYNFLVDTEHDDLYAVDLDSASITSNYALPSNYIHSNKNLSIVGNKYKCNSYGLCYPTKNTDLLCYNMMILDTISHSKVSELELLDYYDYVRYLRELGFGKELTSCFIDVYNHTKNKNPVDYFDQIPMDRMVEANYKIYQIRKNQ